MSTHANIIIQNGKDKQYFYRNSDGYPDGTLPSLKMFMSWVKEGKIRDNVLQASGWLILIGADENKDEYIGGGKYKTKENIAQPSIGTYGWRCGSYEPTTEIHSDIQYIYTLDLKKLTILVQAAVGENTYKKIMLIKEFSVIPNVPKIEQLEQTSAMNDPESLEIV